MEHGQKKPYTCNICGKEFVLSVTFKAHTILHQRESPYSCTWCGEVFAQKSSLALKNHMRHHLEMWELNKKVKEVRDKYTRKLKGSLYMCKICNKTLSSKYTLIKHLMLHKGDQPVNCKICNTEYSDKSSLRVHMQKLHAGDEPSYMCEVCGVTFNCKYLLNRHFQEHKHSMVYYCSECDKPYRSKKVLAHHKKSHTAEVRRKSILITSDVGSELSPNENGNDPVKISTCQICGRHLTSHDSSMPHSVLKHGENSLFTCSVCDENKNALNHIQTDKEHLLNSNSIVCEALENKEKITLYIKEEDFTLGRITKDREDCMFEEQGRDTKVIRNEGRQEASCKEEDVTAVCKEEGVTVVDEDLVLGVEEVIIDKEYANLNTEVMLHS